MLILSLLIPGLLGCVLAAPALTRLGAGVIKPFVATNLAAGAECFDADAGRGPEIRAIGIHVRILSPGDAAGQQAVIAFYVLVFMDRPISLPCV